MKTNDYTKCITLIQGNFWCEKDNWKQNKNCKRER